MATHNTRLLDLYIGYLLVSLPLKSNRKVALSEEDKKRGQWTTLSSLCFDTDATVTLYLEGVPFPVLLSRQVGKTHPVSERPAAARKQIPPNIQ